MQDAFQAAYFASLIGLPHLEPSRTGREHEHEERNSQGRHDQTELARDTGDQSDQETQEADEP